MKTRIITTIAALLTVCSALAVHRSIFVGSVSIDINSSGYVFSPNEIKSGTVYYENGDGYRRLTLDNAVIESPTWGIISAVKDLDIIVKGTCSITAYNGYGIEVNAEQAGEYWTKLNIKGNGTLNVTTKKDALYFKASKGTGQFYDGVFHWEDWYAYLYLKGGVTLNLVSTDANAINGEGKEGDLYIEDNATLTCRANKHAINWLNTLWVWNSKGFTLYGNGNYSTVRKLEAPGFSNENIGKLNFDNPDLGFDRNMDTFTLSGSNEPYKGDIICCRGIEVNAKNFPDANFRKFVASLSGAEDGVLTHRDRAQVMTMDVKVRSIESLEGIQYFPELRTLKCQDNELTKLNVSENKNLKELYCYRNKISGTDMTDLINSLPDNSYVTRSICVYSNFIDDHNVCDKTQASAAKARGWNPTYYDKGSDEYSEFKGSDPIKITATNFAGDFREYIITTTYGEDGFLTESEIEGVKTLNVSWKKLPSLKGIEYFTALTELNCSNNELTRLDLSQNTMLKTLICNNNKLEKLDLTNNKVLTSLKCHRNNINGMNMDDLVTSLPTNPSNNYFPMYVYDATAPSEEGNLMTTFQVSDAKAKGWMPYRYVEGDLWKYYEGVEVTGLAIDASHFPDANFRKFLLEQNYGKDGLLSEEEISQITELRVNRRSITSMKGLEYFTALTLLDISNNQIGEIEMEHVVRCLEKLGHGGTFYASFYGDSNWLNIYQATRAKNCGWQPMQDIMVMIAATSPTWQAWGGLPLNKIAFYLEFFNITDENLMDYLMSCDWAREGYVTNETLNTITSLVISNRDLTELGPLVHLTKLKSLYCWGNQFETLPLSSFTELVNLYCQNNKLKSLDLSKNTNLERLDCSGNEIKTLDLSNNTKLSVLFCEKNELEALDLSNNQQLKMLDCHQNNITSLDLSNNTHLNSLYCSNNQLTTLNLTGININVIDCSNNNIGLNNMTFLVNSLPLAVSLGGGEPHNLFVYDEANNDRNVCTTEQVQIAKDRGWNVNYYTGGNIYFYPGTNGVAIDKEHFPDNQFRKIVEMVSYDKNRNGFLTENEIEKVTSLKVLYSEISDLTGVEYFTEITELNCCDNFLTKLDLSKNTKLNKVNCWGNMIKGDKMDALIASLPRTENGELYVCSESVERDNEITDDQVLEAKRKGWNVLRFNGTDWTDYQGIITGISDASRLNDKGKMINDKDVVYDLQGRKLDRQPAEKGVYIINGRKVVIR